MEPKDLEFRLAAIEISMVFLLQKAGIADQVLKSLRDLRMNTEAHTKLTLDKDKGLIHFLEQAIEQAPEQPDQ